MDIISEAIRGMEQTSFVLVKCQLHMLDVGHGLRLEHLVYVMLDIECAIQHEKSIPAMTVHSTANNHTPDITLVLFSDAGISKMLAPVMPPIDPSVAMGETKHGLIFKINSVPIAGMSTKVVHHPGLHCSTLLPIQDGAPIQASGMQCKSPQVITHGLCGYLGVMMSWYFCHPIKFWSEYANPVMVWLLEVTHYVDGLVVRARSLVGNVSTTELLCVSHWNVWRHLQPSSWFAAYPLSLLTMVDDASYSLLN